VYTPNAKDDLSRLKLRHEHWDPAFLAWCKLLEKKKPVIFCGDLNVAHTEIDLARPKDNVKNHGFTPEERIYRPHVTLARRARPVEETVEPVQWHVSELVLIESLPYGDKAHYEVLGRWAL